MSGRRQRPVSGVPHILKYLQREPGNRSPRMWSPPHSFRNRALRPNRALGARAAGRRTRDLRRQCACADDALNLKVRRARLQPHVARRRLPFPPRARKNRSRLSRALTASLCSIRVAHANSQRSYFMASPHSQRDVVKPIDRMLSSRRVYMIREL